MGRRKGPRNKKGPGRRGKQSHKAFACMFLELTHKLCVLLQKDMCISFHLHMVGMKEQNKRDRFTKQANRFACCNIVTQQSFQLVFVVSDIKINLFVLPKNASFIAFCHCTIDHPRLDLTMLKRWCCDAAVRHTFDGMNPMEMPTASAGSALPLVSVWVVLLVT